MGWTWGKEAWLTKEDTQRNLVKKEGGRGQSPTLFPAFRWEVIADAVWGLRLSENVRVRVPYVYLLGRPDGRPVFQGQSLMLTSPSCEMSLLKEILDFENILIYFEMAKVPACWWILIPRQLVISLVSIWKAVTRPCWTGVYLSIYLSTSCSKQAGLNNRLSIQYRAIPYSSNYFGSFIYNDKNWQRMEPKCTPNYKCPCFSVPLAT